jgi:histidine ammonia-lyase
MNETMQTVKMGKTGMTLDDLVQVARNGAGVTLTAGAKERIGQAWQLVARWVAEERTVYGVTTGFGALSDVAISKADTRQLQLNVLRSHAVGVGPPLDDEIVRAMMALRVNDFCPRQRRGAP